MIDVYPYSLQKQLEVQQLPEPNHVWIDGARIVVYTGSDIPAANNGETTI